MTEMQLTQLCFHCLFLLLLFLFDLFCTSMTDMLLSKHYTISKKKMIFRIGGFVRHRFAGSNFKCNHQIKP